MLSHSYSTHNELQKAERGGDTVEDPYTKEEFFPPEETLVPRTMW